MKQFWTVSSVLLCLLATFVTTLEIATKDDLQAEESLQNKKVVGIKKHKNYEIVLYEYDNPSNEDDDKVNETHDVNNEDDDNLRDVNIPIFWHPTNNTKTNNPISTSTSTTSEPFVTPVAKARVSSINEQLPTNTKSKPSTTTTTIRPSVRPPLSNRSPSSTTTSTTTTRAPSTTKRPTPRSTTTNRPSTTTTAKTTTTTTTTTTAKPIVSEKLRPRSPSKFQQQVDETSDEEESEEEVKKSPPAQTKPRPGPGVKLRPLTKPIKPSPSSAPDPNDFPEHDHHDRTTEDDYSEEKPIFKPPPAQKTKVPVKQSESSDEESAGNIKNKKEKDGDTGKGIIKQSRPGPASPNKNSPKQKSRVEDAEDDYEEEVVPKRRPVTTRADKSKPSPDIKEHDHGPDTTSEEDDYDDDNFDDDLPELKAAKPNPSSSPKPKPEPEKEPEDDESDSSEDEESYEKDIVTIKSKGGSGAKQPQRPHGRPSKPPSKPPPDHDHDHDHESDEEEHEPIKPPYKQPSYFTTPKPQSPYRPASKPKHKPYSGGDKDDYSGEDFPVYIDGPPDYSSYSPSPSPKPNPYRYQSSPSPYGQPSPSPSPYGQPSPSPYGQSSPSPYGQPSPSPYAQPNPYGPSTPPSWSYSYNYPGHEEKGSKGKGKGHVTFIPYPGIGPSRPPKNKGPVRLPTVPFQKGDHGDHDHGDSGEDHHQFTCKDPTGKKGICQEYFKCSTIYTNYAGKISLQEYKCALPNQVGICCPIIEHGKGKGKKVMKQHIPKARLDAEVSKLIQTNLPTSIINGDHWIQEIEDIERELLARSVTVKRNTPAFGHHRFFPSSKKIRDVSRIGFSLLQTSNDLSDRLQLTNEIGGIGLKSFRSSNTQGLEGRCPAGPFCQISKYRTIDGSCNNVKKPKLGQSLTPLSRVLQPAYADGRWEPRISVRGFNLPSPRALSQSFIPDLDVPHKRYTLFTMQFGQFVDHDISSVPMFTFGNNSGIDCCQNGQFLPDHLRHPNCFPIEIPPDDPFYAPHGQRCMNFVRSRMAPRIDCSLGYADQMNALTHWIDASNVYGSNQDEMRDLRAFQGGMLQFSQLQGSRILLPLKSQSGDVDYKAGDDRVNEMQGLMMVHLLWFREHNRIANELARLNPFWNDELIFQEARRLVIAEYQHIIYNEWLPIIVGREYMDTYGILPLTKGHFKDYDPDVDPSVENSFSAAAFRMGHTLVQGIVRLIDDFGQASEAVVISEHSENAKKTRAPGQVDKWLRGLAQQSIQNFDPFVTNKLNGHLFENRGSGFGMDLSSLNIQRGRDHGIPGYNHYRELCQTGIKATKFEDFNDWIPNEMIEKLKRFYAHVDDVDLWVGGLSETSLPGSLVGPTFTCIIGDQFARSKRGDRYFYDIGNQPHSFNKAQLAEIRKASFARIVCDNSDNLDAIQPSAFLLPDFDFNSLVDCQRSTRIPRVDLRAWANEPTP